MRTCVRRKRQGHPEKIASMKGTGLMILESEGGG